MNGLEIFIIPLIALVVWILQYIFRGPEEKKPAGRPGARPGSTRPTANRPARRQTTDLDRYLEETRKRRQLEETKPVVVAEVVQEKSAAERAEEMQRERRKAATPPKPPPPPRPQRPPQRTPTALPEAPRRPVPLPPPASVARPIVVEPVPVAVVVPVEEGRASGRTEPIAALDSRRREERRIAAAPMQVELARLLKSKNGLAAVFVLQEIFGQPISRRPHR